MQLGYSRNILDCFRSILSTEGVRAFYISLPTTLAMNIPYGCVMVSVNESLRKFLSPICNQTATNLIAGGFAGAIAALLTNPLDVIKTRLQIQNLQPYQIKSVGACPRVNSVYSSSNISSAIAEEAVLNSQHTSYTGASQVFRQILKEQGFWGLMRGSFPRVLVHSPSVAISWTTYEFVKNFLPKKFD